MNHQYMKGIEFYSNNEAIHEIGVIQDQGFVIAVKYEGQLSQCKVVAVSENLNRAAWLDISHASMLMNKTIYEVFDPIISNTIMSLITRFQTLLSRGPEYFTTARNFQLLRLLSNASSPGGHYHKEEIVLCCSVIGCATKNMFILELEDVSAAITSNLTDLPNSRILQSGDIVSRIKTCETIHSIASTFLDSIMEVVYGYDRGMIYRFEDDDSGHVIYENIRDSELIQSSYLDHRFPAEDIPPQARYLYLKNVIRFIFDVNGEDSRILSTSNDKLDLTMSFLRGSSKCHLKYLSNMGVVASLSIAIVVEGRLWGLYILHSYIKPVRPTVEERIMLEMVGSITSMRIQAFLKEQNDVRKLEISKITLALQSTKSVHEFLLVNSRELLHVLDADAIVIYDNDQRAVYGDESTVLNQQGYEKLKELAKANSLLHINTYTEGLTGLGAGVIFYTHQYITLAFIRRSRVCDVKWAGRPDIAKDPNAPERLKPRSSFEIYLERARRESRSWSSIDLELAQFFVDHVVQYLHSELLASFRLSLDQSNSDCIQAIESAKEHYEFFAHMSHELRTPFHGVMSSLQILDAGGSNINEKERKEIIESALECGKTMLRTLDDILTIAKSRNSVEVVKLPVQLGKVFASTRRMMSPIAEHKLITFTSYVAEVRIGSNAMSNDNDHMDMTVDDFNALVVLSDEARLGQISNNLINNAIKFTPPGGQVATAARIVPSIADVLQVWSFLCQQFTASFLSTEPKNDAPGDANAKANPDTSSNDMNDEQIWYVFTVQDSGCGVKEADMISLFDAYKQVSSSASKTYQGTGLGLHICRLHIEIMGGILGIASTYEKGSMFLYAVPMLIYHENVSRVASFDNLPALAAGKDKEITSPASAERAASMMLSDINVKDSIFLVVDDSLVNLRLTKRKIQLILGEEVQVMTANDGIEGIEAYTTLVAQGKQPMLRAIFMDYHMPRCSGIDAMKAIRNIERDNEHLQPCYIVAFTADLSAASSRELMAAGANEVLPKPTPAGQLERVCQNLIVEHASMQMLG